MVYTLLIPLLLQALLLLNVQAAPLDIEPMRIPRFDPMAFICQNPILEKWLCPAGGINNLSRATILGTASGVMDPDGAQRYPVRYAKSTRWAPSTLATSWELP